jgi:hypothetical protein
MPPPTRRTTGPGDPSDVLVVLLPGLRRAARRVCAAAFFGLALAPPPARAQDPRPRPEGSADRRARAREEFRKGYALLNAGDCEHAIDFFLRSRAEEPSGPNTRNAAVCLDRLGRYDEALEMYEELLLSFPEDLDDRDRAIIGPAMAALRRKVGGLDVSANVDGLVVVDARPRGALPLRAPMRILAGRHVVRILKDGYATFEAAVTVAVGETVTLDARLEPLERPRAPAPPREARVDPGRRPEEPSPARRFVTAFVGYAGGGTLHGDAEGGGPPRAASGPTPCSAKITQDGAVVGYRAGLRAGYRLARGLLLELSGGYMSFGTSVARDERCSYRVRATGEIVPVRYELADEIQVQGPFASAGASYRWALWRSLALSTRAAAGLIYARASDPITGTATTGGPRAPVSVSNAGQVLAWPLFFVLPEVGADVALGGFRVGLSIGAAFFPVAGPRFDHAETGVKSRAGCAEAAPRDVGCSPNSKVVAGERASGPFMLWVPQIEIGYAF